MLLLRRIHHSTAMQLCSDVQHTLAAMADQQVLENVCICKAHNSEANDVRTIACLSAAKSKRGGRNTLPLFARNSSSWGMCGMWC